MKKILIILFTVLVLLGVSIFCYFKFRFKLEVTLKDEVVPFGYQVNLKDYILSSNVSFKDKLVILDKLGENEVTIEYEYKNKVKEYTFKVNVVDGTAPIIYASKNVTAYKGEDTNLLKNVICADFEDDYVDCHVEGTYDLNTLGKYNLKYVAKDSALNETSYDFTLSVVNKPPYVKPTPTKIIYTPFKEIYDKYKTSDTLIGIDISRFQGKIDFNKVKEAGCEFVIIRLGWHIDGELGLDYNYKKYIKDAHDAGLKIGLYLYSEAKNEEEIKESIDFILDNIDYNIEMPIAYDWEDFNDYNSYHMSLYRFNNMAYTFIDELDKRGYEGILYGSKYYMVNMWMPKDYPVWLAQYYDYVTYEGDYKMWQITDKGWIDGINTGVDVDIYYLNK